MAIQKITGDVIATSAVTADSLADTTITAAKLHTTLDLTGKTVTVATASAGDNDTTVASTAFVSTAVANLADSAPSTLDTLNELAAALGDDANFSTTVTTSIAAKLPLAGGTMTGNITLGDNNKAIFGAGSDLQIYHNGTYSVIKEAGTGDLEIQTNGSEIQLTGNAGTDYMLRAISNGAINLYYNNGLKLATTSTGIDVTGTATMDGLTVDGSGNISGNTYVNSGNGTGTALKVGGESGSGIKTQYVFSGSTQHNWQLGFATHASQVMSITPSSSAGNTTFTTPILNLDGANSRVGIGTSSPSKVFNVVGSYENTGFYRDYSGAGIGANYVYIGRKDTNGALVEGVRISGGGDDAVAASHTGYFELAINKSGTFIPLLYSSNGTELVVNEGSADLDFRVESNGNSHMLFVDGGNDRVGIGISPNYKLHIEAAGDNLKLSRSGVGEFAMGVASGRNLVFEDKTAAAERMRIDSSGNVQIGTSSHVNLSGSATELTIGVSGDTDNSGGGISFAHNGSTLNGYILGQKSSLGVGSQTGYTYIIAGGATKILIAADGLTTLSGVTTVSSGYLNVNNGGGGQISLGDYTNTNPIGISEGLWNTVGTDNDFVTLYARSNFNVRGYGGGTTHWLSLNNSDMVLQQHQKLQVGSLRLVNAGIYTENHVGVYAGGVTVNAATSATGWLMSAGTGVMSWSPSGGSIKLGGLAAANTLDDYEEGTWTPDIRRNGGSVSASFTVSSGTATYVKIGRLVYVKAFISSISDSSSDGSSYWRINGVPFAGKQYAGLLLGYNNTPADGLYIGDAGGNFILTVGAAPFYGSLGSNKELMLAFTYETDS